ncbi:hypothetical protein HMN09_01308500 [Mycena chlorophos]|uniref:Uncharacterized protein n=1 Tax=Mycena chlorophos TaxID=658473 RepID=A0A8H6S2C6_MYCCL|nr:hypothetical protein HMN09_01308500 [Mycena chlorophos]
MQLASHGARAVARHAPSGARNIHIPPAFRLPKTTFTQRIVNQTRTVLGRFVAHLTAPGVGATNGVSVTRAYHAANPSIQQRLSFSARHALSRPIHLKGTFLPRAPVVQRSIAQVGLGTARNFSSGRPVFAHLMENVPVVGRAFYEADWELQMRKEMEAMRRPEKKTVTKKTKEMIKPNKPKKVVLAVQEDNNAKELEHYFPAPVPTTTTALLIPLAPTPTARLPLPEFPSPDRLPLKAFLDIHDEHSTHSLRVSSLFTRLDNADVWSKGAVCSAYSTTSGPEGVCTVLKVEFVGWTKAAVRGVIGESGTGWCVLEEYSAAPVDEYDDDDASSILSGLATPPSPVQISADPSRSLVLPTLDFSSSFRGSWGDITPPESETEFEDLYTHSNNSAEWSHVGRDTDTGAVASWFPNEANGSNNPWLSSESLSDDESDSGSMLSSLSTGSSGAAWLGFSADFGRRVSVGDRREMEMEEPMESAFA